MSFRERVMDSLNALAFRNSPISVHTRDGEVGRITDTNALKGEIVVRLNPGAEKTYRGRDVADLDTSVS